ncbi:MAG: hypothetical protein ACYTFA_00925 [Planctomycetota bacterium]
MSQTATLADQVDAFFRARNSEVRDELASSIADAVGGDIRAVARAVETANLWVELPSDRGVFQFESTAIGPVGVSYALPVGYDPARRYPTIVCMPEMGASADNTLALAEALLGPQTGEFILICPHQRIGGSFHQPTAAAEDLRRFVRLIRKRIHTDTDRMCLFGIGAGGEAAWLAAIAHADLFSGVVTLSAYPRVLYPEQAYTLLLGNLKDIAVLTVWWSADDPRATARQRVVAAHNRGIVEFAKQVSLPITGVELPYGTPPHVPADEAFAVLNRRRPKPGHAVSHWFRYPAQGTTGWLRQAKHAGEVWEADQLSILPSPATDRDGFMQDVIKANLGYIGGRVEGQTITIEAQRCARIDLLFVDGMIDLASPVTVVCNRRERHEGMIRPSIKTLLDSAYAQWDFRRLVWAQRSFSIKARAAGP